MQKYNNFSFNKILIKEKVTSTLKASSSLEE